MSPITDDQDVRPCDICGHDYLFVIDRDPGICASCRTATILNGARPKPGPMGERCEADTAGGYRCHSRAFALLLVSPPAGTPPPNNKPYAAWICGTHQNQLRKKGWDLSLLEKWRKPCGNS